MQLNRNSSQKPGTNLSFVSYFNVLLHGIQDGFDFSFRKKESIFYFQLLNISRLFEEIFQEMIIFNVLV